MSDFLSEVLAADAPVPREVTIAGKTGTVFFKRISAGQRASLLAGQRVQSTAGAAATVEIDLGDNQRTKCALVHASVCTEDGKPFFKTIGDVLKLEDAKVNALHRHAAEVNADPAQAVAGETEGEGGTGNA